MKDIYSESAIVELLPIATIAADNTPVAVDLLGFEAAEIALAIGVGGITFTGANKIEFVLTHSDDNSTYTNVTDADMKGVTGITTGIIKALTAAHATAEVIKYGYLGGKRYLKLLADFSGTHGTGTPLAACVVKGRPHVGQ